MFLGIWEIDDLLTFYANTHNATTGAAVDADSAPSYRIYENETTTPILTGTMALLDASNTDGFYSEQVTLSAANGFENGKCYCIRIQGIVSSVTGAKVDTFQVGVASDFWTYTTRTLTSGPTIVSDDLEYEEWTIVKGNSYSSGNQPKIFTMAEHGPTDLSEYTWAFTADIHADNENSGDSSFSGTVTVTTATGASRAVRVDLSASATSSLALGRYTGAIRGTDGSEKATPKIIAVTVVDDPNA
jgi:hypothetical protein